MLFHGSDRRKSSCGFSYAPIKNGQNPLIFYAFPYCIPPRLLPDSFCMHGRQKSVKELFFTFTVPQSFFVSIIRPCFVLPLPRLFSPALSFSLSYALFSFFSFPAFPRAVPIFFFSFFARVSPSPYIYFFFNSFPNFSLPRVRISFPAPPPFSLFSPSPALCILFSLLLLGYTLSFPFPLPLSPRLPLLFSAIRKALQKRFALQGQKRIPLFARENSRRFLSVFITSIPFLQR